MGLFFTNDFDLVAIRILDKVIVWCSSWKSIRCCNLIAFSAMFLMECLKVRCTEGNMGKAVSYNIRAVVIVIGQFQLVVITIKS